MAADLTLSSTGSKSPGRRNRCTNSLARRRDRASSIGGRSVTAFMSRFTSARWGQGRPAREAAEHLARKLRDILWRRREDERARVDRDSHRVPLDLNALIPIPRRILRKGFVEAGQEWMWANWGVRWPIRGVTFAIERERDDASGVKPVAVFRFISEDWSPWIALLRMRKRWPELSFRMIPSYLFAT